MQGVKIIKSCQHILRTTTRQRPASFHMFRACSKMAGDCSDKTIIKESLKEITEGKANVLHPSSVFYNPVQEFNRDLTIAVISELAQEHAKKIRLKKQKAQKAQKEGQESDIVTDENDIEITTESDLVTGQRHEDGLDILEGLSASGLRSVRFGLEIPGVRKVVANDIHKTAVDMIKMNIERNNLDDLVEASHGDAAMIMLQHKAYNDRFHVVDLDPYGSAAPFLDTAVQAVSDGGLLCITCTDASVLCGNNPEKCFSMYGSMSLRSRAMHEVGLRIILRAISLSANRYSRYIEPLLSLSVDFYFRVFVRVNTGQIHAKYSASKSGMMYLCVGCGSHAIQPLCNVTPGKSEKSEPRFVPGRGPPVTDKCENCGYKHQIGGPMYIGPLHNRTFVEQVISRVETFPERFQTHKRIIGMLRVSCEELDVPLYYEADELFKVLKVTPMKIVDFRSAILNAGYQVSYSHACRNSIKTDAPNSVIWDILRKHVSQYTQSKRLEKKSAGFAILSQKPSIEVSFETHPDANPMSREKGLNRFPPNPAPNWGPKPRARKLDDGETLEDRRLKNQGKRKKKMEKENTDSDMEDSPSKSVEESVTDQTDNSNAM